METNVGTTEGLGRVALGGFALGAGVARRNPWLVVLGAIGIGTAAIGYCPINAALGRDTARGEEGLATAAAEPDEAPAAALRSAAAEHVEGVPIFPGSRAIRKDIEGDETKATFVAAASLAEVSAFYDRALPGDGWRIRERETQGSRTEYEAVRGGVEAELRLRASDGGTEIRIEVEPD